jgi:tRNA dimethylallyltransferase
MENQCDRVLKSGVEVEKNVVVIVGPTAVGKTALGVKLAKMFNGEVVNGDASQVYREMNIGTAKVTAEEAEGIPHHLLDIVEPKEPYTVADFQKDARAAIADIHSREKLPILVGGTGLYVKAALYDYRFSETAGDPALRKDLEDYAAQFGNEALHQKLIKLDPEAAKTIHPNNVKRVIRSIEKRTLNEGAKDAFDQQPPQSLYPLTVIGLTMDRKELYKRIDTRVDLMMAEGLMDEAREFYNRGLAGSQAMQSIGYKELFRYFDQEIPLDEAVRLIKRNTRHFAKRQLTWFHHQMNVTWFDVSVSGINFSKIINFVAGKLGQESK